MNSQLSILEQQMPILTKLRTQVPNLNPFLYGTDSYKISHILFETDGVEEIYSNMTPRFDKYIRELLGSIYDGKYVVFGIQWMLMRLHTMAQTGFFDRPKDEVIAEMREELTPYIGTENLSHFEDLHDLGYLPIVVKALDEGTLAPVGVPFLTIRNTLPAFEWLPNYLETLMSTDLWKQITIATVGRCMRLITNQYAVETTGGIEGTEWQNHDFHVRGGSGMESAAINGAGFLLSSCGTDNIPALWACRNFYQSTNQQGLLAGSVSAGEHSVTTSGILTEQERALRQGEEIDLEEAERRYTKMLLTKRFPTGIFSYVSDSFDFWSFVTKVVPSLKNEIMARDGKFVVRGDSGNPVDVICGVDESKYEDLSECPEDELNRELFDIASELISEETPHGEQGDDEYVILFKYNGELKKATLKGFQWDRHDKQYYYLDTYFSEVTVEIVDIKRTAEHKGTIECLWDTFGGTVNDQGYKVLDSHIGMIYGDGINAARSQEILSRLKAKGFASTNIVFGVGSYLLNLVGRDHLGMAIKATNTIVNIDGERVDKPIYKDPKTDTSKKSARGLISVHRGEDGELYYKDMQSREAEQTGLLSVVYMNGQFQKLTNIFKIREQLWG